MPNWCVNKLTIVGKLRSVQKIQDTVFVEHEDREGVEFKFNNVIPMPEELRIPSSTMFSVPYEILFEEPNSFTDKLKEAIAELPPISFTVPKILVDGYGADRAELFKEWVGRRIGTSSSQEEFERKCFEHERNANIWKINLEKHGHPSWYSWAVENWGTKWDAVDCRVSKEMIVPPEGGDGDSPNSKMYVQYTFETAWSPPIPVIKKLGQMFPKAKFKLRYFEGGVGFQGTLIIKKGKVIEDREENYSGPLGG